MTPASESPAAAPAPAPTASPTLMIVSGSGQLDAIDMRTGDLAWQYTMPSTVRRFLLTKERVYVLNSRGELICLDLASGAPIGGVRVVDSGEALLYQDGILYVVGTTSVVAIDANGQHLWSRPLTDTPAFGLRGAGIVGQVMQPDYDTNSI